MRYFEKTSFSAGTAIAGGGVNMALPPNPYTVDYFTNKMKGGGAKRGNTIFSGGEKTAGVEEEVEEVFRHPKVLTKNKILIGAGVAVPLVAGGLMLASKEKKAEVVEVEPSTVEKVISAPMRSIGKLMMLNPEMSAQGASTISNKNKKEYKRLAKKVPGLKVYIGGSPVKDQMKRAWEGKGIYKNPVARAFGAVGSGLAGLQMKVMGGDYFNPLSNTAVIRSNVSSVGAHEIGHAADYKRQAHPVLYSLMTSNPFTRMIPEGAASGWAIKNLKEDRKSLKYLLPAFSTYVAAAIAPAFGKNKKLVGPALLAASHIGKEFVNFDKKKKGHK